MKSIKLLLVFPIFYSFALLRRGMIFESLYALMYSSYAYLPAIFVGVYSSWFNAAIYVVIFCLVGTIMNLIFGTYKIVGITRK